MVRRMVPSRPTTQQTISEGAEPASRSAWTLLVWASHVRPSFRERAIAPPAPTRHRTPPAGGMIITGDFSRAVSLIVKPRCGGAGWASNVDTLSSAFFLAAPVEGGAVAAGADPPAAACFSVLRSDGTSVPGAGCGLFCAI